MRKDMGITTNLSDHDMNVIVDHINYWVSQKVRRGRVDDRHLFFCTISIAIS